MWADTKKIQVILESEHPKSPSNIANLEGVEFEREKLHTFLHGFLEDCEKRKIRFKIDSDQDSETKQFSQIKIFVYGNQAENSQKFQEAFSKFKLT